MNKLPRIIAKQSGQRFLVDIGNDEGKILDYGNRKVFPPMNIHSLLSRGYWENVNEDEEAIFMQMFYEIEKAVDEPLAEYRSRDSKPHRPNLFKFATSELSQDAFICWLINWAHQDFTEEDKLLHHCSRNLLRELFKRKGCTLPDQIYSIEIIKQLYNLDIFVVINDQYGILIEDKTFTNEHSNQLERYLQVIKRDPRYEGLELIPVYFKIGNQSNVKGVNEAGYQIFNRQDFLHILESSINAGVTDNIFLDYYVHLRNIDQQFEAFKVTPIDKWNSYAWQGFYAELQKQLDTGNWGYIANQAGGFQGFWWNFKPSDKEYQLHIQLNEEELCFKIRVHSESNRSKLRNEWSKRMVKSGELYHLAIKKPPRFGNGKFMSIAVLSDDYRRTGEDRIVRMDETVAFLKKVELLFDETVRVCQEICVT